MRNKTIVLTLTLLAVGGCKMEPAAPTVDDAKQVWMNIHKHSPVGDYVQLVDFKKTDGQMAEVNGTKVYTFFYETHERYLKPLGQWKPGDIETIKSNYGFQRTENGWEGPDGEHFNN